MKTLYIIFNILSTILVSSGLLGSIGIVVSGFSNPSNSDSVLYRFFRKLEKYSFYSLIVGIIPFLIISIMIVITKLIY